MPAKVALLSLHLHIPGADSLKAKRSRLKPLLARLQREFNISVAEVGYHDRWGEALLGCVALSTEAGHAQRTLQQVAAWVDRHWRDVEVHGDEIDMLT
ncbi:MAG: DUF503 domain-containing protein [Anaerolineales bacterium]|nr:DUF503 domain-containing protein [Anaerolineales bacterium]